MNKIIRTNKPNTLSVQLFGNNYIIGNTEALNSEIVTVINELKTEQRIFGHHNLHSLALCESNNKIQQYLNQTDMIWIDGMPVIWMLKCLNYKIYRNWRITFLDWETSLFNVANNNRWNLFLLGSTDENIKSAQNVLEKRYPEINFSCHHGYILNDLDNSNTNQALKSIRQSETDILLVGMGMPNQEEWILDNKKLINAKVILPIGGYFDYIAGTTYTPPRWSGRVGLEWLFRLLSDPVRLGYRYLIEPWPVFLKFVKELIRYKFYQ